MLLQLLIVIVAAFMLVSAWRRERQGSIGALGAVGWSLLWIAVAVVAINPDLSSRFAGLIGVGRGADAVVYVSVLALFWLLFRVFLRLDRLERDLTAVVRAQTLATKENERMREKEDERS